MNKVNEMRLKLKEIVVSETSRAKARDFILKSKKIYAVLGAGIVICFCILAFNAGAKTAVQPTGYSEEYLHDYALLTSAWVDVSATEDKPFQEAYAEAEEYAKLICNMVYSQE